MLVFTIGEWVIPGFIFIPVVVMTLFSVGLGLVLWEQDRLEK